MKVLENILWGALLLFILNNTHFVQAQETAAKPEEELATFYFKSESIFKCNVKLPENYKPDIEHTLVIGLHGDGGTPDSFINVWDDVKGVNFIYAAPQGPYSIVIDKLGNEWSLWSSPDLKVREQAAALISSYIADLVTELKEQFKIDDIYLFGFSQGAIFSYVAGLQNYQLYKGILVFSGAGISEPLGKEQFAPNWLEDKYLEPANSLRVFISHGTKDQAAKYELGVKSNKVLTSYGYDVTFYSFEGGHMIDPESLIQAMLWINKE
jgi:phospholipase/carboxylesterase